MGILKLIMMGVFLLWELVNVVNRSFFFGKLLVDEVLVMSNLGSMVLNQMYRNEISLLNIIEVLGYWVLFFQEQIEISYKRFEFVIGLVR